MKISLLLILPVVLILSACTPMTSSEPSPTTNAQKTTTAPMIATPQSEMNSKPVMSKDVVDTAIGSKEHTTLVAAVTAAGLVETLRGVGPYTVFAPTNAAFAKLPSGTVDGLLKPEQKPELVKILTYHVVPGSYMAKDLKEGLKLKTVQGQDLTFTMKSGNWYINDTSMISAADIAATNGFVHVIDGVVMPK